MKRICKFSLFIYMLFVSSSVFAAQIGVWDGYGSGANAALNISSPNNSIQKITKSNISAINPNLYPVIVFTKYQGFDSTLYNALSSYIKKGGKLVISLPVQTSEDAYYTQLAKLLGVSVYKITNTNDRVEILWLEQAVTQNALPQNSKIAKVSLNDRTSHLAVFGELERHESAVSLNSNGSVISWNWGTTGSKYFNDKSMQLVLEKLLPKETQKVEPQTKTIKKTEQKSLQERQPFKNASNRTTQAVRNVIQQNPASNGSSTEDIKKLHETREQIEKYQSIPINFGTDISDAQQNLEYSKVNEVLALYYLKNNNVKEYEKYLRLSKECANKGFCGLKEVTPTENRGIWFDRGTITGIKSRAEMGRYMERLKNSGINTIYFETINAGYTIYPSKIGVQNPLTKGRDPLSWAIEEAHSRNMKLQAWVWIFAVGNDRHNKIINKPNDYAGPILEKNMRWALLGEYGNLRPKNQPEFWIDPSNKEGVKYLLSLIDEIVTKYNVDGIQLDYIRYPFQSSDNLMGFNHNSTEEFSMKTGEKLLDNNYQTNILWNRWKESNINNFVKTVYSKTKNSKADAKVSAAIFVKSPQNRLFSIQQSWENWSENEYIDALEPMSYSITASALSATLEPLKTQIGKCPIYPGVALQHVNEVGIMEQTFKIREEGFPGVSFFALAQLTPEKSQMFEGGFFSKKVKDPNYSTKDSAEDLLNQYKTYMNNVLGSSSELTQPQKNEISSMVTATTEVLRLLNAGKIQDSLYKLQQIEKQNDAFFKNYALTNDFKRQTAVSYLKKAENLIKIYTKKRA